VRTPIKRLAGRLPQRWQQNIKRIYYARQIRRGRFRSEEPEWRGLSDLVSPGDWVIDVGANVGQYTLRLSELVKSGGRVFAFEPIPLTFELLTANCALSSYRNVTLFNVAASDAGDVASMHVPEWEPGGSLNLAEAHLSVGRGGDGLSCDIVTCRIDALELKHRVSFVKVDAEGHEVQVVQGMMQLIERDHPVLVVEGSRANSLLESLGYAGDHQSGSPNWVWRYRGH